MTLALPLPLTAREFSLFQGLVEHEAGIVLGPTKQALLVGRLSRRVHALALESFGAYYRFVTTRGNEAERVRMLDCLCTHETHFFREPEHFTFLRESVLPEWTRQAALGRMERRVRVWSAGCSTGEEPCSLAMTLLSHFPLGSGWEVEVLATDLSTWALERARQGLWPVEKAASIPPRLLRTFMLKGVRSQEGWMQAGPELRATLRFARVNLNDERGWPAGPFELDLLPQRAHLLRRPGPHPHAQRPAAPDARVGLPLPRPRREPHRHHRALPLRGAQRLPHARSGAYLMRSSARSNIAVSSRA